jgi:hypothetical protein
LAASGASASTYGSPPAAGLNTAHRPHLYTESCSFACSPQTVWQAAANNPKPSAIVLPSAFISKSPDQFTSITKMEECSKKSNHCARNDFSFDFKALFTPGSTTPATTVNKSDDHEMIPTPFFNIYCNYYNELK